jgi:hypothetical protein
VFRKKYRRNLEEVAPLGLMAANPLPIHDFSRHKFVGPTGALTEIKISPASAIFLGVSQCFFTWGNREPNSAFPWKKGNPRPTTL